MTMIMTESMKFAAIDADEGDESDNDPQIMIIF